MFKTDSVSHELTHFEKRNAKSIPIVLQSSNAEICQQESFSQRLKFLREINGDSQIDLSFVLLVSRQTIGSYETGRTEPCFDVLRKLSSYYRISVDCLICNKNGDCQYATKLSS